MSDGKKSSGKPRRHWPKGLKRQIVEESNEPGVSVCEVARRYDLDPAQLFAWRKKFAYGADRGVDCVESAEFVAVDVSEDLLPEGFACEGSGGAIFRFEIVFPNGRHLFVPASAPPEVLSAMIAAVEAS